jgi:hypothetical protein
MVRVLGVDVDADLLSSWRGWLAPERQPFFSEHGEAAAAVTGDLQRGLSAELRDTFTLWKVKDETSVLWFDEASFVALPRAERAALVRSQVRLGRGAVPVVRRWLDVLDAAALKAQADGHRFVWWPSLLRPGATARDVLVRVIESDGLPSRHRDVANATWRKCSRLLPAARALAGTFPRSSGPNCFGTVMAAAGVEGAADEWMLREPFLGWLDGHCEPGGDDDRPGTVLVWSDCDGTPMHAAVTIGDGWAIEKPSQTWATPRGVLRVRDVVRANRSPAHRLRRHRIR